MHQDFHHIVIGAGISGLGMAHRAARRGVPTLVLEGEDRVGGCMNSRTFPGGGDFWVEAGSHTCFNSYGYLLDTLADLGLTDRLIAKGRLRYQLWRDDERRPILSALHLPELIRSLPWLLIGTRTGKDVAEYFGAGLGRRNYRELFRPALRAVVCQEVDRFPADLLFRRKPRRKEIMRSFTFPGGLSDIPAAIARQAALQVRTGRRVTKIAPTGDGYQVFTAGGEIFEGRYLTLAVPPDAAAVLLPEDMKQLRDLVGGIGVAEIETLALCLPVAALPHRPPSAGLIAVDDAFYAMVSRDYLPHGRYRGFTFHFRPRTLDADAQLERGCRVLGVTTEQLAGMSRVANKLPALRAGHSELVRKIDALLAGGRLALTGNWFCGVSIEDCLTRSHRECERLFPKKL